MDNLTHGLFGVAMARAGLGRGERWAAPLLAVAANAPDFESLLPAGSTANYLLYHRGISHSVLGILVEAALLTWVTLRLLRWRGAESLPGAAHVFTVALLGAASHLLLDWLNTYGLRPWLPFDQTIYYGDLTFIIDPWFWLLLWSGCYLTAPEGRAARWLYGVMGVMMGTVLVWGTGMGLAPLAAGLWIALACAVLLLRVLKGSRLVHSPLRGRIGRGVLAAVGMYLVLLLVCSRGAQTLVRELETAPSTVLSSHPTPGIPWRYSVLADHGSEVRRYDVNLLARSVTPRPGFATHRDDPALQSVRDTLEFRAWLYFARHPVAARDGDTLLLGDARYRLTSRRDWTEMRVPLR